MSNAKEDIAKVRKVIKSQAPKVSVRGATGTSYGWVDIRGSRDKYGNFTPREVLALNLLGIKAHKNANGEMLDPDDRRAFVKKYGKYAATKKKTKRAKKK